MRVWLDRTQANRGWTARWSRRSAGEQAAASGKIGRPCRRPRSAVEEQVTRRGGYRSRGVREDRRAPVTTTARSLHLRRRPRPARTRRTTDDGRWLNGQARSTIKSTKSADANALDIVRGGPRGAGPRRPQTSHRASIPGSLDTTLPSGEENSPKSGHAFEAFVMVLIVVFVFLQGFPRPTVIR